MGGPNTVTHHGRTTTWTPVGRVNANKIENIYDTILNTLIMLRSICATNITCTLAGLNVTYDDTAQIGAR